VSHDTLVDTIASRTQCSPASESRWGTGGLDSVLGWSIFPKPIPFSTSPIAKSRRDGHVVSMPLPPPVMDFSELSRLVDRFVRLVHIKNPILDIPVLRQMVKQIDENGPSWSTSTCLVALACALGALAQEYDAVLERVMATEATSNPGEDDLALARKYWCIAEKRLGLAMGYNGIQSVQCFCLAGYLAQFPPTWLYPSPAMYR
jgi:hypothetical protein